MTNFLREKFDYCMNDLGDPRVRDWIGFSSPAMTLTIIGLYLFAIYRVVPSYMKNREPYSLKSTLFYYNIFQIICCAVLTYGVATSGWTTTYSWGCQPIDYSDNPEAVRMLNYCYYGYVLKGIDLIETVFFVLRKKSEQVSKLHVYHHSTTFFIAWVGVKYIGGGMATFSFLANSYIHTLMYTYYLLASFGPEWQRKLIKWKVRLTMCQMIQFCVIICHALQSLHPDCRVPKQLLFVYGPHILLIFFMFWKFYEKNYLKKIH